MGRPLAWWMAPFVGTIVTLLGLLVGLLIVSVPVGRAVGAALGESLAGIFDVWVPAERIPDLEVAPGEPGFLDMLPGPQLHFHDREKGRTRIAAESWIHDGRARVVVGEYDGAPSRELAPGRVRSRAPLLALLVVRVDGPADVWWESEGLSPSGPGRAEAAGALNLLVLPGRLALWTDDGPRHEIEVEPRGTVWCSLGAGGLVVDRRR